MIFTGWSRRLTEGATVQAIYVDASGEWAFLADRHFIRADTFTIFAAPPGSYFVTTGDSTIVKIVDGDNPSPRPQPNPRPDPQPGPEPDPQPDPGPPPLVAKWAIWVEEQMDRDDYPAEVGVMTDPEVQRGLADRGLEWRIYDDDQPSAKWLADATTIRPAFMLMEQNGQPRVFPAPKSAEELETIIRENVVR
ncbi:MAG: hypothetical protein AAGJ46_21580 [Planctomycetota bacterium]